MRLEEAIALQLKNDGPLTAIVAGRVYPVTYPQNATLPAVVYQRTSKVPEYTHDGEAGFAESRFQVSSFARTYAEAKNTASKVKAAFRPWMANQTMVGGLHIGGVFLENEFDLFNSEDTEPLSAYQVLGDYMFLTSDDD